VNPTASNYSISFICLLGTQPAETVQLEFGNHQQFCSPWNVHYMPYRSSNQLVPVTSILLTVLKSAILKGSSSPTRLTKPIPPPLARILRFTLPHTIPLTSWRLIKWFVDYYHSESEHVRRAKL
jgi:hypothetical protein